MRNAKQLKVFEPGERYFTQGKRTGSDGILGLVAKAGRMPSWIPGTRQMMASDPSQDRREQGGEVLALWKMQALLDRRPFPSFGFTAPEPGAPVSSRRRGWQVYMGGGLYQEGFQVCLCGKSMSDSQF